MDVVLLRQKDLEKEVSNLTNELVPTAWKSFERAKEQVLFLYHALDLSLLDPLKVVRGEVMVDEEAITPRESEHFPYQADDVVCEGGDPGSPQSEPPLEVGAIVVSKKVQLC